MHNGHTEHEAPGPPATQEELTQELIHDARETGPTLRRAMWILAVIATLGVVAAVIMMLGGLDDHTRWKYYAVAYFYVFSLVMGIPMAGIGLRFARAQWRRPTSRAAELFALAGPVMLLFFLPIMAAHPGLEGRNSLWMDWRLGPWFPDLVMLTAFVGIGLAFVYASVLPDLAAVRDHGSGRSRGIAASLAYGWIGTAQQWAMHKSALGILGAMYIAAYATTHMVFATDFAMVLTPGWKDPIFPAFHAVTGLQMGLGLFIVVQFALRKWGGLARYFEVEQFWAYGRLLLALTLFWFYFFWSGFILFWYGRLPHEQQIIALLAFGDPAVENLLARPQLWMFGGAIGLSFITAFLLIMWNPVRRSILGPAIVGVIIIIGNFFDRLRIYVNTWSIEQVGGHELHEIPHNIGYPGVLEVLVLGGMLSGVALLILLASRVVPFVSLWETREALLLRVVRPFGVGHAHVVAKPD